MRISLRYWVFWPVLAFVMFRIPYIGTRWWIRVPLYFVIVIYAKRSRFFYRQAPPEMRFKRGETVVVTGANTGIGAETAKQLADRGGKVILTARNVHQAEEVLAEIEQKGHSGCYVLPLDLGDLQSIRNFADTLLRNESKLDCLILNAGYYGPKQNTKDGFEQSIGVNHLGHMYLTYLLMDRLIQSGPSRVVVVSSDVHNFCSGARLHDLMFEEPGSYADFKVYAHSKLCNLLFTSELAERSSGTTVAVNITHLGQDLRYKCMNQKTWCTNLGTTVTVNAAHPGTPVESKLTRHHWLIGNARIMAPVYKLFCREAADGAQTLIYCALADECGSTTGKYYENVAEGKRSKAAKDREAAKKLWDISCDLLNILQNWPTV